VADKRSRVQRMFAAIAPSYDLNNRLHSLWMDQRWRRKAVELAELKATDAVVDVACGTGDLALHFAQWLWRFPGDGRYGYPVWYRQTTRSGARRLGRVLAIDFTWEMLPLARAKARVTPNPALRHQRTLKPTDVSDTVRWINGDAQSLPLPDACCDVVSIAFGIRNVADPAAAIAEFYRVLRPGGRLIILEFSLPTSAPLRGLYNFYFRKVLPRTATLISGDKTGAYKYLPESVNTFISREQMAGMMRGAGFSQVEQFPLTFGVCVCYRGLKSERQDAKVGRENALATDGAQMVTD
jgi:demethylmenaquinone methyltransferase/2-methoxy-6-polyprenyl-1,4-benzoquinol methylase